MKPIFMTDIEQGEEMWFQEKLGKVSASNASKLVTNKGVPSKQREDYLYSLVAEKITGQRVDTFKSEAMEEGNRREQESRELYQIIYGVEVERVGLVYMNEDRNVLCSPDGIVDREYGLELKNVLPKTQVKYLSKGSLPSQYFSQLQFSMMVTGFKYWMFCSYSPGLNPLILKIERDEKFIETLQNEIIRFCKDIDILVEKIG